jgi:hypothetical protein
MGKTLFDRIHVQSFDRSVMGDPMQSFFFFDSKSGMAHGLMSSDDDSRDLPEGR